MKSVVGSMVIPVMPAGVARGSDDLPCVLQGDPAAAMAKRHRAGCIEGVR